MRPEIGKVSQHREMVPTVICLCLLAGGRRRSPCQVRLGVRQEQLWRRKEAVDCWQWNYPSNNQERRSRICSLADMNFLSALVHNTPPSDPSLGCWTDDARKTIFHSAGKSQIYVVFRPLIHFHSDLIMIKDLPSEDRSFAATVPLPPSVTIQSLISISFIISHNYHSCSAECLTQSPQPRLMTHLWIAEICLQSATSSQHTPHGSRLVRRSPILEVIHLERSSGSCLPELSSPVSLSRINSGKLFSPSAGDLCSWRANGTQPGILQLM